MKRSLSFLPLTSEMDEMEKELINLTVAQQRAKLKAYEILKKEKLPIPPDLRAEIEGMKDE